MVDRTFYLYLKNGNYDDIITILNMDERFHDIKNESDILIVKANSDFSYMDLVELRKLILQEILIDFVGFYKPHSFNINLEEIKIALMNIGYGVFNIQELIIEICLENLSSLETKLKSFYYKVVGVENIETILGFIENNLNASRTSKNLFMHRNTLNYRLDNFYDKTEMDAKDFKVALAMYLLFKR